VSEAQHHVYVSLRFKRYSIRRSATTAVFRTCRLAVCFHSSSPGCSRTRSVYASALRCAADVSNPRRKPTSSLVSRLDDSCCNAHCRDMLPFRGLMQIKDFANVPIFGSMRETTRQMTPPAKPAPIALHSKVVVDAIFFGRFASLVSPLTWTAGENRAEADQI
jgi:hypothetical protein